MSKKNSFSRVTTFVLILALGAILTMSSCDDVKDAIDAVSYKITITNGTDDALTIFEKVDDSAFEVVTTINPGASASVTGVVDSKIDLEARRSDGTVVASRTFNQSDDTDQT